ncbi:late embryogenesis abundant protein D-34-like [Dioscorea cayenensis subsp. rotundata]|uniref:Late embryogenesis abundant protein D-34-like n=1 Tax=Dioscorea cayennensis subsp. rotundata TaxID=55577 RepID=A0AB40CAX9_DIOCR|nr:late embryogenesis abundant protein D-34-like [Dioscorea cayenensis subsp. rotundata]
MSQEQQPRKPQQDQTPSPIKYSDVFNVSGSLSDQTITPQDAAMMQSAETLTTGQTLPASAASTMQSAATRNKRAGHVTRDDISPAAAHHGVSVTQSDLPSGRHVITETVAGQVVEQHSRPEPVTMTSPAGALKQDAVTIGEVLEATAAMAGRKPVTLSDAAAIQAAEAIITGGSGVPAPGGVAAEAQSAVAANELVTHDEYKTKLSDVLSDATMKLPGDKPVTKEDAERVIAAELRNNEEGMTAMGGVAASVSAAARINQERKDV